MPVLRSWLRSNFFIRIRSWEYWPFGIVHAPLYFYWLWLSIKARSLTFFSASNPGILMGGMFGESKYDVMCRIPEEVKPVTIRLDYPVNRTTVQEALKTNHLSFPLIFKPDLGERGWRVRRIDGEDDIDKYLAETNMPFLVQTLVELPLEFGVFYVRYPSEPTGRVVSIAGKEMLSVNGDGHSTLQELILKKDRARLQWETLREIYKDRLHEIPAAGERLELVSIGNHCLGTKFLDANHLITPRLTESFDRLSKRIDGFFFGRFDLRTQSVEALERGEVMVLELNGCGAEPAHIYQPGFSFWKAIGVLFRHWHDIYRVSKENHDRGTAYISFAEARRVYTHFRSLTAV